MDLFGALVVFVIVWWLVFFLTLPFGVKPSDAPEIGHEPSAPERPRLLAKVIVTTAIAAALTGLAAVAVNYDLIAFREIVKAS